jgi:hypothetical protein
MNPPVPVCTAILICDRIVDRDNVTSLEGLPRTLRARFYPCGHPLAIFARLTSAHGTYHFEIQLRTLDGEVVWREGPKEPWSMADPLRLYDVRLILPVVFPKPGTYEFVLLANDTEVGRHVFHAAQVAEPVGK